MSKLMLLATGLAIGTAASLLPAYAGEHFNALNPNALNANALNANALASNALVANSLAVNALTSNGSVIGELNGVRIESVTLPASGAR